MEVLLQLQKLQTRLARLAGDSEFAIGVLYQGVVYHGAATMWWLMVVGLEIPT